MLASGKLTLMSKKPQKQCLKVSSRKPVKDCYCYSEAIKTHVRPSKIRHKPASPCRRCRSELELGPVKEIGDKTALTSPISCETLRRVQKIDYAPRSQFLRNVQSKICELHSADQRDCFRTCPRSSSYHRFITSARTQDIVSDERTVLPGECKCVGRQKSPTAPANVLANEQNGCNGVACASSKSTQVSPRKLSKSTLRKTVRSRRQIRESRERPASKSPTRSKRTVRLHKRDCPCCCTSESERKTSKLGSDKPAEKRDSSEYCVRKGRCLMHDDPTIEDSMDQEMEDLRKFREQNYFETHGSSHTLTSSRSSGSLQQYLLNERLFPEPVGRIHRRDLVVTIPPCATTQRKRVHYFPRYVVRQEKDACNTSYGRKRCQNCPLTGHAVDLGVLKARPPLNSLALKYQKRAL